MTEKKYHWVNESVIIDFKLPRDIENVAKDCEELDLQNNEGAYYNMAESLGYLCKEAYVQGHLTKEQWKTVSRRYENYG